MTRTLPALVAIAAALVGCSGDVRPFEEAIEVVESGIETLDIRPPDGSRISPLYVNPGERVAFTLEAGARGRTPFAFDGEDRDWRVSDSRFASIDENGVLTARANGTLTVEVNVGDVVAQGFDVTVSDAALETITGIERAEESDTADTLDACVPTPFNAVGMFNDGTTRRLSDVAWSVVEGGGARTLGRENGSVELTGTRPGQVLVRAESGGIGAELPVTVADTLRSIEVGPTGILRATVGNTLALNAIGTYALANGSTRERDITRAVDWSVVPAATGTVPDDTDTTTDIATITRIGDETPGVVSAERAGNVLVRARCGEVVAEERSFTVPGSDTDSDTDGLSFGNTSGGTTNDDGTVLTLSIAALRATGGSVRLRVFNDGANVTEQVAWSIASTPLNPTGIQQDVGQLDTLGSLAGQFTPLSAGTATVTATFGSREATLTIVVNP